MSFFVCVPDCVRFTDASFRHRTVPLKAFYNRKNAPWLQNTILDIWRELPVSFYIIFHYMSCCFLEYKWRIWFFFKFFFKDETIHVLWYYMHVKTWERKSLRVNSVCCSIVKNCYVYAFLPSTLQPLFKKNQNYAFCIECFFLL